MKKEMTPREVCEMFFSLFNEHGVSQIEKVFETAKEMYFKLEGEFK